MKRKGEKEYEKCTRMDERKCICKTFFLSGLGKRTSQPFWHGRMCLPKTFNREFTFVYMGTNLENRASHLYQGMEFVGIFNQKTFEFTDVSYALRALLNNSGRKKFPVPAWMYALPGTEGSGICPKETGERKKGYCDHRSWKSSSRMEISGIDWKDSRRCDFWKKILQQTDYSHNRTLLSMEKRMYLIIGCTFAI